MIKKNNFYYLAIHIKLSTVFYSSQLLDVFSYETVGKTKFIEKNNILNTNQNSILVYIFNILNNNLKLFVFINNNIKKNIKKNFELFSVTELFNNANWLEREASELSGVFFYGKKDIRNLMLQYGDSSTPFKKSYPCIGLKEIFYDSLTDSLVQNKVSVQF